MLIYILIERNIFSNTTSVYGVFKNFNNLELQDLLNRKTGQWRYAYVTQYLIED